MLSKQTLLWLGIHEEEVQWCISPKLSNKNDNGGQLDIFVKEQVSIRQPYMTRFLRKTTNLKQTSPSSCIASHRTSCIVFSFSLTLDTHLIILLVLSLTRFNPQTQMKIYCTYTITMYQNHNCEQCLSRSCPSLDISQQELCSGIVWGGWRFE